MKDKGKINTQTRSPVEAEGVEAAAEVATLLAFGTPRVVPGLVATSINKLKKKINTKEGRIPWLVFL